jgi:hypothetical protein
MTSSGLNIRQVKLDELQINASRTQVLEQDVKEKNLLIGKLRHEGLFSLSHVLPNINSIFSRDPQ